MVNKTFPKDTQKQKKKKEINNRPSMGDMELALNKLHDQKYCIHRHLSIMPICGPSLNCDKVHIIISDVFAGCRLRFTFTGRKHVNAPLHKVSPIKTGLAKVCVGELELPAP